MFGSVTNLIVDKLKPYLTKIFRNFDAANFNFSFGGSLTLSDLQFRPTLLQDLNLDLPFQATLLGSIGKIYVEIGFHGITVTVNDLCILISNLKRISYDEKKETELEAQRKRDELLEIIRKAAEASAGKKEDEEPGFFAKQITSMIQGATVIIENVHIRFEDDDDDQKRSLASGLKLNKFTVETMEEISDWTHGLASSDKTFYKKGDLNGLSVYWNSNSNEQLSKDFDPTSETTVKKSIEAIVAKLKDSLKNDDNSTYVLKPIAASVKAMITKKPEKLDVPFSLPKYHVDFQMNAINFEINDYQYEELMFLQDKIDQWKRGRQYLKYRPNEAINKGNASKWWKFAYLAISRDVARRRKNWSWEHIKAHRELRDNYKDAYLKKICVKTISDEFLKEVQDLEDALDNFNIIMVQRETEETNSIRKDLIQKKVDEENSKKSYWSTLATSDDVNVTKEELEAYIKKNYSADDTAKISNMYDFDQLEASDAEPIQYPEDYNEIVFGMNLKGIQAKLTKFKAEANPLDVILIAFNSFDVSLETHPAVEGLKAVASMNNMKVTGVQKKQDDVGPLVQADIFKSVVQTEYGHFLKLSYETHPSTSKCDQKITFNLQQSQFIYDFATFQKVVEFFASGSASKVQHVGGPSMWSGFKNMSANSMKTASNTSATLDIDVSIAAPCILVPENGNYSKNSDVLILNLGTLTVRSSPREKNEALIDSLLTKSSASSDEISPKILNVMFNHFDIQLNNFEILITTKGEDVNSILYDKPVNRPPPMAGSKQIAINVYQCIVAEDVRFPKLKVNVCIPSIDFDIIDTRLLRLAHLGLTLPLPKPITSGDEVVATVIDVDEDPSSNYSSELSNFSKLEIVVPKFEKSSAEKADQFTDMIVDINFENINLSVCIKDPDTNALLPLMEFKIHRVEAGLKLKTFGMTIEASIAWMTVIYSDAKVPGITGPVYLLYTPIIDDNGSAPPFIKCHLFSITPDCPKELAGSIKQNIELDISTLDLIVHQDSIQSMMSILFRLKNELDKITPKETAVIVTKPVVVVQQDASTTTTTYQKPALNKLLNVTSKFRDNVNDIMLKATVTLSRFSIKLTSSQLQITQFSILDCLVDFEDKPLTAKLSANLGNIEILNLESGSLFSKILTVEGNSKLVTAEVILHKDKDKAGLTDPETEVKLSIGGPKLIILGSYLRNVKKFVDNFQAAITAVSSYSEGSGSAVASVGADYLYQNDAKILLDINMESPNLVLAKSDGSLEVLYYYFGSVKLQNQLKQEDVSSLGKSAILDTLSLVVSGVKLTRAILDPQTKDPIVECLLLEPLQITITVCRNLSRSWYTAIPVLKAQATLSSAVVAISDDDVIFGISCAMDVVNNIIDEHATEGIDVVDSSGNTELQIHPVASINVPKPDDNSMVLDFEIVIEKVGLSLYKGELSMVGITGIVPRNQTQALGGIFIEMLKPSGNIWANKNLSIKLGLNAIRVQDFRPEASALKDLITSDNSDASKQLLDLSFQLENNIPNAAGPLYSVILESKSFTLIFNIDFINALAKFGISIVDRIPKLMHKKAENSEEDHTDVVSLTLPSKSPAAAPAAIPLINANINMNEFTIVVLENPKSTDTNAILLSCSGGINVSTKDGVSQGSADLSLSSFTSRFDINKPSKRLAEILRPANLHLDISLQPNVQTLIDVELSEVIVHISAGTLHLINKVLKGLNDSIKTETPEVKIQEDYSDVWDPKKLDRSKYWFLQSDVSNGPPHGLAFSSLPTLAVIEKVTLTTGRIYVTLESGVGLMTTPLIFLDTGINAQVTNWSNALNVQGLLKITAGYNNTHVGEMEYFIEPQEAGTTTSDDIKYDSWELTFDVQKVCETDSKPAQFAINIDSEKPLELMISKCGLEIVKAASASFTAASSTEEETNQHLESAPYVFKNTCGADMTVNIDGTSLLYFVNGELVQGDVHVADGQMVQFGLKSTIIGSEKQKRQIQITIPNYNFSSPVLIHHAQSRFFNLSGASATGLQRGIVVDIEISHDYSTHITVHTIVQVINELDLPVDVFVITGGDRFKKNAYPIASIQSKETISLPLNAVYDQQSIGLQFKPKGYSMGQAEYNWQQLLNPAAQHELITESSSTKEVDGIPDTFNFNIIGIEHVSVDQNTEQPIPRRNFSLRLKAPMSVCNLLPVELTVISQSPSGKQNILVVQPGQELRVTSIQSAQKKTHNYPFTLMIANYQGQNWSYNMSLDDNPNSPASGSAPFVSQKRTQLFFQYEKSMDSNLIALSIYCPFWIVNYTRLDLSYKNGNGRFISNDPAAQEGPLMFPDDVASVAKPTLCVMVPNGQFSKGLEIDSALLSTGMICPSSTGQIELSVNIDLSNNHLTKIVTLTPRTTITNTCSFPIIFAEQTTNDQILVPPNSTMPYWTGNPRTDTLIVRFSVAGTRELTAPVKIHKSNQNFLKLPNMYGGLCFSVSVHDTKTTVLLSEFAYGEIPVLFINNLQEAQFQVFEQGLVERTLGPTSTLYHAWEKPENDSNQKNICWTINGRQTTTDLNKDSSGTFQNVISNQIQNCNWFTFTVGLRKIVLFTTGDSDFGSLQKRKADNENAVTADINLSLQYIGISVLDNIDCKDVLYGRISSTDTSTTRIPGIGLQFKLYPLGFEGDLRINEIRIDNQTTKPTYPHILSLPTPTAADSGNHPAQFIVVHFKNMNATPKSTVTILDGLIAPHEFNIGADMALVGSILELLKKSTDAQTKFIDWSCHDKDYSTKILSTDEFFASQIQTVQADNSILFLNDFQISKAIFNLSFSMAGSDKINTKLCDNSMVNFAISSLGKLNIGLKDAHFELDGKQYQQFRTTTTELTSTLTAFYTAEAKRNAMKNFFNLDVPGSPFNLLKDVGGGVGSLVGNAYKGAQGGRPLGGALQGIGSITGKTIGGVAKFGGGLLGAVGGLTNALHIPIVGGVLGGVSGSMTSAGTAMSSIGDSSDSRTDNVNMRPPRNLQPGVPLKPYSTRVSPESNPVHAESTDSQSQSQLLNLLQQTPNYRNAGPVVSQFAFGQHGVVITEDKIFHMEMSSSSTINRTLDFDRNAVESIKSDGGTGITLGITGRHPLFGTAVLSQHSMQIGDHAACQALLAQFGQAGASRKN